MAADAWDIGDLAHLSAVFTQQGVPVDPELVRVRLRYPNGTTGVMDATRLDTGSYYADVPVTMAGLHSFRFEGTGDAQAAGESQFDVRESNVL